MTFRELSEKMDELEKTHPSIKDLPLVWDSCYIGDLENIAYVYDHFNKKDPYVALT